MRGHRKNVDMQETVAIRDGVSGMSNCIGSIRKQGAVSVEVDQVQAAEPPCGVRCVVIVDEPGNSRGLCNVCEGRLFRRRARLWRTSTNMGVFLTQFQTKVNKKPAKKVLYKHINIWIPAKLGPCLQHTGMRTRAGGGRQKAEGGVIPDEILKDDPTG